MFVVKRNPKNPILSPNRERPWEAFSVFNWCPIEYGGKVHVFYRAMSDPEFYNGANINVSSVGHAVAKTDLDFGEREQFIAPEYPWEKFGCEDPRVTKLNDKFYIFYTALSTFPFSADGIKVAVAVSKDLKKVDERHLVTPFNAKAMSLFPEKIKGKMVAILTAHTDTPPAKISIAEFDSEEEMWSTEYWKTWHNDIDSHALPDLKRKSTDHIEVGAPPVKTDRGWLLLYSHIQNYGTSNQVFGVEALLLDINDPKRIIGRTAGPILTPEEIYEEHGHVPKIVFPTGALIKDDKLIIFYGAADTVCATAEVRLDDLLNSLTPEARGRHVRRYVGNPILKPNQKNDFESFAVFNPAAIDLGGKIHVLYRAMGKDATSTIGYFGSKDGYSIDEKLDTPIYIPRESFEMKTRSGNSGCEDPRIVKIGDTLYMCYTAYDGVHAPGVAITSIKTSDFLAKKWNWEKPVLITPQDVDDKDSCLFPAKVGDKYMIMHRIESHVCADFIQTLDFKTEKVNKCIQILGPRPGMWDDVKVGISAPPIKTKQGWLLFYHGVSSDHNYRVGAALFDLQNPTIMISRTTDYIFEPEASYEKEGIVPNVVFPCGVVLRDDLIFIYYGGADTVIGVATIKLSELLLALA